MYLCLTMEMIGQRVPEVTREVGNLDLLQVIKDTIQICITAKKGTMQKKGSIPKKGVNMIIKGQGDMTVGTGGTIVEAIKETTEKGTIQRETPRSIRKHQFHHQSTRESIKEITRIAHTKASTSQSVARYLKNLLNKNTHRSKPAENKD